LFIGRDGGSGGGSGGSGGGGIGQSAVMAAPMAIGHNGAKVRMVVHHVAGEYYQDHGSVPDPVDSLSSLWLTVGNLFDTRSLHVALIADGTGMQRVFPLPPVSCTATAVDGVQGRSQDTVCEIRCRYKGMDRTKLRCNGLVHRDKEVCGFFCATVSPI